MAPGGTNKPFCEFASCCKAILWFEMMVWKTFNHHSFDDAFSLLPLFASSNWTLSSFLVKFFVKLFSLKSSSYLKFRATSCKKSIRKNKSLRKNKSIRKNKSTRKHILRYFYFFLFTYFSLLTFYMKRPLILNLESILQSIGRSDLTDQINDLDHSLIRIWLIFLQNELIMIWLIFSMI